MRFSGRSFASGHVLPWLLLALAALFTAVYISRVVMLTFHGTPQEKHLFDHAHESPRVMTVPLVVLAGLATVVVSSASRWWPAATAEDLARPGLRWRGARRRGRRGGGPRHGGDSSSRGRRSCRRPGAPSPGMIARSGTIPASKRCLSWCRR